MLKPEEEARKKIDAALTAAGWTLQDRNAVNLYAAQGVAVREFPLTTGHADYLLFVDGKAAGVVEAKKEGMTLTGVEPQTRKYSAGLPSHLRPAWDPLPFLYRSNGSETFFSNLLEPEPRSRLLFDGNFHRPETLAAWLAPSPEIPVGHPLHGRPRLSAPPRPLALPADLPVRPRGRGPARPRGHRRGAAPLAARGGCVAAGCPPTAGSWPPPGSDGQAQKGRPARLSWSSYRRRATAARDENGPALAEGGGRWPRRRG